MPQISAKVTLDGRRRNAAWRLSHGRLRDGLYRSLRRTGSSWNMPAPPAIRILTEATCSRGRSTARGEMVRRSQRQHPNGELKSKLGTETAFCPIAQKIRSGNPAIVSVG